MNTTRSLFVSLGVHLTVAVFFVAAMMAVDKKTLPIVEKTVVKIMLDRPQESPSLPIEPIPLPQEEVVQPSLPTSEPQRAIPPKKEAITFPEPTSQTIIQTPPVPMVASSAVAEIKTAPPPKAPEPVPHVVAKAPPPAPKAEKTYAEENLHRIRAILAERLTYPKNAVRLRQQGICIVTFTLGTEREVSQIVVSESSGFELLDGAAKTLIENAAADFPKPAKAVRISVPIEYKLR